MDHDINKRQTWLIKVHNWEFPGNDHNQLSLFGKKVFFFWERFWQSFLEQLITVSSLYKTAHEILYSQVWKSTHTSKTFLKVPIPKRGLLFEENEAFDCQTSEFLKKDKCLPQKKMLIHLSWKGVTKIHTWIQYLQGQIHFHTSL